MAKISEAKRPDVTREVIGRMYTARTEHANRQLLYSLRRGYYDGTIRPTVDRGHDLIYTQYAPVIVDKMAAYLMGNGLTIKLKVANISDKEQTVAAEYANAIANRLYNDNYDFTLALYNMVHTSGLYGDGIFATEEVDGIPVHYSLDNPQNVILGFRDDQFEALDFYAFDKNVSVEYVKETYGIDVSPMPLTKDGFVQGTLNSQLNPFGQGGPQDLSYTGAAKNVDATTNMAKYTCFYDFIKGERVQLFNDEARFKDNKIVPVYHFVANRSIGEPFGQSDFEEVAHIITKIDEKLSEQSDAVSAGVHHKILTDQNIDEISKKWKANKTQAFKVPGGANPGRFEILNTSTNVQNSELLLNTLMNTLRTGSGLQELGQDQIAANVSGRAIAYMFQGVVQRIKTKRLRLNALLRQLVIDDFEYMARNDPQLRKVAFDKDGLFKFKVDIKYPPVLEQDEQIRISNIQTMRQGKTPLISDYQARLLLSDYVDDPNEEAARVDMEIKEANQRDIDLQTALAKAAQPQPETPPASTSPSGNTAPQAVQPQGMEPATTLEGQGLPAGQESEGGSNLQISAEGLQNQMAQQASGGTIA